MTDEERAAEIHDAREIALMDAVEEAIVRKIVAWLREEGTRNERAAHPPGQPSQSAVHCYAIAAAIERGDWKR